MVGVLYWRDLPLHILLLALVLSQVFLLREINESETRLTQVTLRKWFTPTGLDSHAALYTTAAVLSAVNTTLNTYYTKVDQSLHDIGYALDSLGQVLPVQLELHGHFSDPALLETFLLYNFTNPIEFGPFNLSEPAQVQAIFINATRMKTTLQLTDLDHPSFLYIVETIYDIQADVVFVYLELPRNFNGEATRNFRFYMFGIINFGIILISAVNLILTFVRLGRTIRLYLLVRKSFMSIKREKLLARCRYGSWQEIPAKVKLQFFQDWWLAMIVSNVCLIIAAACSINDEYSFRTNFLYQITEAIGVLLTTTTLIRYLETADLLNTAVRTLRAAYLSLVRTVISVLPIFAAYAIFGTVVFAPCSPMVYLLTFICLYLLAVLKVFIQVVSAGFFRAQRSIKETEAVKRHEEFLGLMDMIFAYAHKARQQHALSKTDVSSVDEERPLLGSAALDDRELMPLQEALARLQASQQEQANQANRLPAEVVAALVKTQSEWAEAQVQAVRDTDASLAARMQADLLAALVDHDKKIK